MNPSEILSSNEGLGTEAAVLIALVAAAVFVVWFGSRRNRRERSTSALRPKGRRYAEWSDRGDPGWTGTVARLERVPPVPLDQARAGVVHVKGHLVRASTTLGGPPSRECVYRNRLHGRPESAVTVDLVILADDTGRVGIENLERARVEAPAERHSVHHESVSLYLSDEVEIFGEFTPEPTTTQAPSSATIYGTLGSRGPLTIRVSRRVPAPAQAAAPDPSVTPSQPSP